MTNSYGTVKSDKTQHSLSLECDSYGQTHKGCTVISPDGSNRIENGIPERNKDGGAKEHKPKGELEVQHAKTIAEEIKGGQVLGIEPHAPKILGSKTKKLGDTNNDNCTDENDPILHSNHRGSCKGDKDPEGHASNGDTNCNGPTDVHDTLAAVIQPKSGASSKQAVFAVGSTMSAVDKKVHQVGDATISIAKGKDSALSNVSSPVPLHNVIDPEPTGTDAKDTGKTENTLKDCSYLDGSKSTHFIPANTGEQFVAEGIYDSPITKPKIRKVRKLLPKPSNSTTADKPP